MEQIKNNIMSSCALKPVVIACWLTYLIIGFNISAFCFWFDVYFMDFMTYSSIVSIYVFVHVAFMEIIVYILSLQYSPNSEWYWMPKYGMLFYFAIPSIYSSSVSFYSSFRFDLLSFLFGERVLVIFIITYGCTFVTVILTTILYNFLLDEEKKSETRRKKLVHEVDSTTKPE
jgi:hypothetical protein